MRIVRAGALASAVVLAWACGSADSADSEGVRAASLDAGLDASCVPGTTAPCACPDSAGGTQTCSAAGALGSCDCRAPVLPEAGAGVCGDRSCQQAETCKTCPRDCGECLKCELAPSCSDGLALPSQTTTVAFEQLSVPVPPPVLEAGAPMPNTCLDAQLRLRIARIEVGHQGKQVWLPTGTLSGSPASYYCVVQASDGVVVASQPDAGSNGTVEVALTRPTAQIPDYQGADFAPSDSIFWGQKGPRATRSNLTITYSCFQQKESGDSTWQTVLKAGSDAAGQLAGAGPYGWAFGLGSVGLAVASAAAAAAQSQGDWHMFDVTHTIDKSRLLDLTNGRRWSFERSGGESAFHYPWKMKVVVESWGCADAEPPPPR